MPAPEANAASSGAAPVVASPPGSAQPADWEAPRGTSTIAEERGLVERARAALVRRDGVSALIALREHAQKFPKGQLAEERDALEVQALAVAGHTEDARTKARMFDARHPGSIFAPQIDAIARELPKSENP